MNLFADRDPPGKIICHRAGTLSFKELDEGLLRPMIKMQRLQYGPLEHRLHYRLMSCKGKKGAVENSGAYNCLTWLQELLQIFESLDLPRMRWDWLPQNPLTALPKNGPGFFSAGNWNLKEFDVKGWQPVEETTRNVAAVRIH